MALEPAGTKIETAPDFDRIWFRVQKVLQALLALTICAGLVGVFGGGWLSTTTTRIGPFEVTYERFARKSVPFRIKLHPAEQIRADRLELTIGQELVDRIGIVRTVPTAESSSASSDGARYTFIIPPGRPGDITLAVQADKSGLFDWTLKAAGFGEVSLFQIIYP